MDLNKYYLEYLSYLNYQPTPENLSSLKKCVVNIISDDDKLVIKFKDLDQYFNNSGKYETLVVTQDIIGIHIRFSMIARGGIRLMPYFNRNIIVNLAKTQSKKNLTITKDGAKGGFSLLNSTIGPSEGFTSFISGLLSVVDDNDPYLFLGPDVGTSDYANLAIETAKKLNYKSYQSFFTGHGNNNHKKIGITALGCLQSVKFQTNKTQLSCIIVGSPRGDVTSNFLKFASNYDLNLDIIAGFGDQETYLKIPNDYNGNSNYFTLPLTTSTWSDLAKVTKGLVLSNKLWFNHNDDQLNKVISYYNLKRPQNIIELQKSLLTLKTDLIFFGGVNPIISNNPTNNMISPESLNADLLIEGGNCMMDEDCRYLIKSSYYGDIIDNSAGVRLSDVESNYYLALNHLNYNEDDTTKLMNLIFPQLIADVLTKLKLELTQINNLTKLITNDHLIDKALNYLASLDYVKAKFTLNNLQLKTKRGIVELHHLIFDSVKQQLLKPSDELLQEYFKYLPNKLSLMVNLLPNEVVLKICSQVYADKYYSAIIDDLVSS